MAILKTANCRGKYYDEESKTNVINYITNPQKTVSNFIGSKGLKSEHFSEEMQETSNKFGKNKGVQVRHFIVSFDEDEVNNPKQVFDIGDRICDTLSDEYETVFAVHENTENLHIHIAMNSVSFVDGHRYKGTRKEFYKMKTNINQVFKEHNISPVKYVSNKK